MLDGKTPKDWRTDFYCEHLMDNPDIPKWRGVRGTRFTYARYFEQDPPHEFLYDLKTDPDQYENLADNPEYAEILAMMRQITDGYKSLYTRPQVTAYKKELAAAQDN